MCGVNTELGSRVDFNEMGQRRDLIRFTDWKKEPVQGRDSENTGRRIGVASS